MRIHILLPFLLLTFGIAGLPVSADSNRKFPGKGSVEAYNKACDIVLKSVECTKKSDYQTAVKYDREAISIYPFDSLFYHNLGYDLAKLRQFNEARSAQEQAIALEPNYAGAWISLGLTYEEQSKLPEAEKCYRKAVEFCPTGYEGVFDLGDILRQQGKFTEAREWFLKAREIPFSAKSVADVDAKLEKCNLKEASN